MDAGLFLKISAQVIGGLGVFLLGMKHMSEGLQAVSGDRLRKMIGAETFDLEMELHRLDCLGSHEMLDNHDFLRTYVEEMANEPVLPEPWISGHDLLEIGIQEGRLIGRILKEAYDTQMEDRFQNRADLLAWIKKRYRDE